MQKGYLVMTDIVERLLAPSYWISGSEEGHEGDNNAPYEAADEIERLRAALVKIDLLNTPLHGWSMSDLIDQEIVASGIRAALGEEKKG